MKTILFMALGLFVFCPGALRKMVAQGSRIGFTTAQLQKQINALPNYATEVTNATSALNLWQAPAHFVYLEGDQIEKALADMIGDLSFEKFIAKYDCKKLEKQVQVTKFKFRDAYKREVTEYTSLGGEAVNAHQMNFMDDTLPLKTHWIFEYRAKTALTKAFAQAFYVTSDFTAIGLPPEITNMLQKSQTVVDTATQYLQNQLSWLNSQIQQTQQLQTSFLLLTRSAADREARRKRRQEIFSGLMSWLPLMLLAHK